ncbi:MAG TPA: serine hydrolase domain-containing protein [Actinomycetes bacterium]|nr:serine hydrolase domain-containing protein [Actinomycetes bacterium]
MTNFLAPTGSRQGRLRVWTPRELVALVAGQPLRFPPGTSWSYANTGYILLGLIVEAATGRTLGRELARRILEPLGLRGTRFPVSSTGIPMPRSRGYSLPQDPPGQVLGGPLLDLTAESPSWGRAAGALVSDLEDLTRFFRALLGGRLLPPELLAEMLETVPFPSGAVPLALEDRYGLGLAEVDTPTGRLVGHPGGIPGFLSIVLSTPDGRRQLGIMINALSAPIPCTARSSRRPESSARGSSSSSDHYHLRPPAGRAGPRRTPPRRAPPGDALQGRLLRRPAQYG